MQVGRSAGWQVIRNYRRQVGRLAGLQFGRQVDSKVCRLKGRVADCLADRQI